jgi:hypothetical protein
LHQINKHILYPTPHTQSPLWFYSQRAFVFWGVFYPALLNVIPQLLVDNHPCHADESILLRLRTVLDLNKITTKIAFVVDPSGSVPEGTTTKLIFIVMGVQMDMTIPPE